MLMATRRSFSDHIKEKVREQLVDSSCHNPSAAKSTCRNSSKINWAEDYTDCYIQDPNCPGKFKRRRSTICAQNKAATLETSTRLARDNWPSPRIPINQHFDIYQI